MHCCKLRAAAVMAICVFCRPVLAAPAIPIIQQSYSNTQNLWVLIHGDVPFLVPIKNAATGEGTALVTWSAVAGATHYEFRIAVNGVWTTWQSVGDQLYANLNALGVQDVQFEVRACDDSGCSSSATSVVNVAVWRNVGQCDPSTGKQMQLCVDGRYCTFNSSRQIDGGCKTAVDCP